DYKVTGVQTCALPIFGSCCPPFSSNSFPAPICSQPGPPPSPTSYGGGKKNAPNRHRSIPRLCRKLRCSPTALTSERSKFPDSERSEERRVGKESRVGG